MKISIITAVKNNREKIEDCIRSVLGQTYKDIEFIVIDGESTDGTLEIIRKYEGRIARIISEKDNGMYHALNKGIKLASGDIVGILHSDDVYADNLVIEKVVEVFNNNDVDSVYGDLEYVDRVDKAKVIRYWKSVPYKEGLFERGWMPAHPSFFVKRSIYEKYGLFDTNFKIAADYEAMVRFIYKYKISSYYLERVVVKMTIGGLSNKNIIFLLRKTMEDYKICKRYGFGFLVLAKKNLLKVPQFFRHKNEEESG